MTKVKTTSVVAWLSLAGAIALACSSGGGNRPDGLAAEVSGVLDSESGLDAAAGSDARSDSVESPGDLDSPPGEIQILPDSLFLEGVSVPDDGTAPKDGLLSSGESGGDSSTVDFITIPIADLSTHATFFQYEGHKTAIQYFAVLDDEGNVHAAFNACEVCYGAKLGYRQEGDVMVCNNCGNQFPIASIGKENQGGGCWPGYLEVQVTAKHLLVAPDALEAGSWLFE